MGEKKIKEALESSILELIGSGHVIRNKIVQLVEIHKKKIHFAPLKYRVLGGFLQSLNIKFGNFLEVLMGNIIKASSGLNVISVSEKKNLIIGENCERIIDAHINHPPKTITEETLKNLYEVIFTQKPPFLKEKFDIDLLVEGQKKFYYIEIKYNDDHDTGKYKDINRKAIKTYAGLRNEYKISSKEKFELLIYYFNTKKRYYPSYYLRDGIEVLRGNELFQKLNLSTNYHVIEEELKRINVNLEERFDRYTKMIFDMVNKKSQY